MFATLRPALVSLALMTVLTGLAYPLAITGLANGLSPEAAQGSLVRRNGQIIGSALIGQSFKAEGYLQPRPSANGYDASSATASNLAPSNSALIKAVATRVTAYRTANGRTPPIDAVTTSASGLDPDISPANALDQAARIARARGVDPSVVTKLIAARIRAPLFDLYGLPRVNVLATNLALDAAFPAAPNPPVK